MAESKTPELLAVGRGERVGGVAATLQSRCAGRSESLPDNNELFFGSSAARAECLSPQALIRHRAGANFSDTPHYFSRRAPTLFAAAAY